jgi:hypothetical protein
MAEYRAELIAHRGGEENITPPVRAKIEMAVSVRFRRLGVEAYIQSIYPIDKRHRRVWPAMTDLMRLEAHELAILRDLGDVPTAKEVDIAAQLAALHDSPGRATLPARPERPPAAPNTAEAPSAPAEGGNAVPVREDGAAEPEPKAEP